MTATLFESSIESLPLVARGKVRDIYAVGDRHLLIVTTDRLSAFDVVLPDPIPDKGRILTELSRFWFDRTADIVPHHLADIPLESVLPDPAERARADGRSMIVERLDPLPLEAVVRGYLIGSGWNDYQRDGSICGIALPPGLPQAARLPEPVFTPSTKAAVGGHDQNVGFDQIAAAVGQRLAARIRELALALYRRAADYARDRGIIIADTKFEFGTTASGELKLIDEVLTPDSSRFWRADAYRTGISPPSFDKQYIRDYLESLAWDKRPPAPHLPVEVIKQTSAKYQEARDRLLEGGGGTDDSRS